MNNFIEFFQHLPEKINPEILRFGFFSVGWYALMYVVAFLVIWLLLRKRLRLGEDKNVFENIKTKKKDDEEYRLAEKRRVLLDFLLFCFLGVIIGGRLGYVFFYNFQFYLTNPLAIISPFDLDTGQFIGIYGMSYHGGLIGAISSTMIFIKKYKINFWALSDFVIPAIPAGYFFGRVGNFLNGELFGRETSSWIGMYFPFSVETSRLGGASLQLRHPSQLYEAFLEGILLFLILWSLRNKKNLQGKILALYLIGYAVTRFLGEFFREPDAQVSFLPGSFTLGQLFSAVMFFCGLALLFIKRKNVL